MVRRPWNFLCRSCSSRRHQQSGQSHWSSFTDNCQQRCSWCFGNLWKIWRKTNRSWKIQPFRRMPQRILWITQTKSATIILRGGAEQFIKEAERSLNDAIMIVRRCFKTNKVVAGGGATEMELSKSLKEHAVKVSGKEQLVMNMYAKALEIIPRTIADNAGLDSLDLINKLRNRHRNYKITQTNQAKTTFTLVSTSTPESETTKTHSSGNLFWSRSTLSRLQLRLPAPFFRLTRPSETQNLSRKSSREE